jgi:RNA polymerase sigma-70 factor, ECF subfamily
MEMSPQESAGTVADGSWGEEALTRGLSGGDPVAVEEFLSRTHRPVYAMTARLTADPDLRHDWTHDALLKILDELSRGHFAYRWPGCFWSWFQKRSYFLLINLYNKNRKLAGSCTSGQIGEEIMDRLPLSKGADPSRLMEDVESRQAIDSCLENLASKEQQRALRLFLLEDLPYQSVAEEMGAELNTVRSWIRRARISVRRCLAARFGWKLDEK